jgi:hypothetical protein
MSIGRVRRRRCVRVASRRSRADASDLPDRDAELPGLGVDLVEPIPDEAVTAIFGPAGNNASFSARRLAARKSRPSIMAEVGARWLTFDPERGRQAEPMWRSNWSAARSRKNSMQFLHSISVWPSAVRRSNSTGRISEPSCSRYARRCACSLSSRSRSMGLTARWKRGGRD